MKKPNKNVITGSINQSAIIKSKVKININNILTGGVLITGMIIPIEKGIIRKLVIQRPKFRFSDFTIKKEMTKKETAKAKSNFFIFPPYL
ncbi:hypothetical protein KKG58_05005 [Patescibacteria group bacterium]|nr:hypothetical protein [Patescibacteria group bacterium]